MSNGATMIFDLVLNLVLIAALIVVPALYQTYLFEQRKTINHTIWAAGLTAGYTVVLLLFIFLKHMDNSLAAAWFLFFLAARLMFFDYLLNRLRHKPQNHLGNNLIDRIMHYLGGFIPVIFARVSIFMFCGFLLISENARYWQYRGIYNMEHLTAMIILFSILLYGAAFTYRFFKRKP